jgi:signal transduction histidine kinase
MRSLRTRLLALWLMLAVSGTVTGVLLVEFYRQSANAQVSEADERVTRACRDLGDRYAFFVSGWRAAEEINDTLRRELTTVVQAALARTPGVEGGIWRPPGGSLAYAFPTYEGTGPKTDVPAAELDTIRQVNADALASDRPITVRQVGRSQVLVVHACPLGGPLSEATGWTMTRVFTGQGHAYNQLLAGLALLALTVLGSAAWLGWILLSWSRKLTGLETALAGHDSNHADVPELPFTGEHDLDRLVHALNSTGARLGDERRRASAAERLAALGRVAAGLAHEIRNPIAAMRLKAENALAVEDPNRRAAALRSILDQIGRLDGLLRDLLAMTQRREPRPGATDVTALLERTIESHRELAAGRRVTLRAGSVEPASLQALMDAEQMQRALDNLILNAVQNARPDDAVTVSAAQRAGELCLRVEDTGPGIPEDIRDRLFDPFVTARPDGTGLGLAIVREIVRAQGGEVLLVESPQGAAFEIRIPCPPS